VRVQQYGVCTVRKECIEQVYGQNTLDPRSLMLIKSPVVLISVVVNSEQYYVPCSTREVEFKCSGWQANIVPSILLRKGT
jgi:hypothetical protein